MWLMRDTRELEDARWMIGSDKATRERRSKL